MERYLPHDVQITESDLYKVGVEQDGCIGNTITSICSKLVGGPVALHPIYYFQRGAMKQDELRMYARHRRRERQSGTVPSDRDPIAAFIRLDQRVFRKALDQVQQNRWAMTPHPALEAIMDTIEIDYRHGGFEEMMAPIKGGAQVAVCFKLPEPGVAKPDRAFHIAHIGYDQGHNLVRFSDNNEPVGNVIVDSINESAQYLGSVVRTWNYVVAASPYASIK